MTDGTHEEEGEIKTMNAFELVDQLQNELKEVTRQRDDALFNLNEYGRHKDGCPFYLTNSFECNCGFKQALINNHGN